MEPEFESRTLWEKSAAGIIPTPHKTIFTTLFFTVFSTITGVGIVIPLLPVYAHDLGAAGLYVGMIFGAFSLSRTLLLPVFGRLSDKKGRKPFIVAGLFCHVLVSAAFMLSSSISSLIIIRFFQGISSAMIMPVVQAYVGEITPQGKEGYSMGMFNMSMFASLSLGPLMGGIIQDAFSMNAAFACMGILSGVGLGLSLWFLPPVHNEYIKHKERPPVPWKLLIVDRGLLGLFAYRFFYTACIGIIWCFLPILSDIKFSLPGSSTGILLMLAVLVSGLLQMPMGFLADRINKRLMVVSGGTICAAAMVMLFYSDSYSHLIRAVSVFGVGGGISMPAVMALSIIKGQEKCSLASVMSVVTVAHSFGMMVGSMAAGLAMDYLELEYVFPCGAAMIIFGIFLFFGLTIPYRKA